MHEINLRSIDLNLLTVFHAIYEEGQITKAGRRLGLTQPAVSHGLSRLRALFGDELFYRAKSQMEATPRARELAEPISGILAEIERVVASERRFDPATVKRELRLGVLDYGMTLYAPAVSGILAAEAPGMVLDCHHIMVDRAIEMLDEDDLDFAIGPFESVPARFQSRLLKESDVVIVAARGHRELKNGLSAEIYAALQHINLSYLAGVNSRLDTALGDLGLTRQIAMNAPHYTAAVFTVAKSRLLAAIPRGPAELYRDICGLELYLPPTGRIPLNISMLRRRPERTDPAMDWAWERLEELVGI